MFSICEICDKPIIDEPSLVDEYGDIVHLSCSIKAIDDMGETSYDGDCC